MATKNNAPTGAPRPRRWHEYDVVPHADDRIGDERRPITKARAKDAIENGAIEDNPVPRPDNDEWRFRHRVEGCDVVVVCGGPNPANNRYGNRIVTAFVDVAEPDEIWAGDEWSKDEIHVAAMLQYLNQGRHDADVPGFHTKEIDVYEPVEYGGHILSWNTGHNTPFCHACRHSTIDGDEWKRRRCPTRQ